MKNDQTTNPYYCPLIHNGLYVEKINQDKVKISACCVNTLSPEVDSIDFENNPYLQTQRELMRAGQPVPGCSKCDNNSTVFNLRHSAIRAFNDNRLEVDFDKPTLNKLDWNVDPVCNARCIQCSAHFSSAWAAEDKAHGKFSAIPVRLANSTRHNSISEAIDLSNIQMVYFNGGEPFLSKEPLEFLKRADELGTISNIQFSTNTNGSVRPSDELIALLRKCKSVLINFSLDGTESEFEYIRDQLVWNEVTENMKWLGTCGLPYLRFGISFTLGIYNVDLAVRTEHWAKTFAVPGVPINFGIQPCFGILSLDYASRALKQVWLDQFQERNTINDTVRNMIENSNDSADDSIWQTHLAMIDKRRNTNWEQRLPALYAAVKKSREL